MTKRAIRALALALPVLCLAATATAANAATVYVSNSAPVVAGGKSCAQPGYKTVQEGIAAASRRHRQRLRRHLHRTARDHLRVKINAVSGVGTATLQMPAEPAKSATSCDTKAGKRRTDRRGIDLHQRHRVDDRHHGRSADPAGNMRLRAKRDLRRGRRHAEVDRTRRSRAPSTTPERLQGLPARHRDPGRLGEPNQRSGTRRSRGRTSRATRRTVRP